MMKFSFNSTLPIQKHKVKNLLMMALAITSPTAIGSDVEVRHDRFTGQTTAALVSQKAVDTSAVRLQPGIVFAVNKTKAPSGYSVQVAFIGTRWRYLQCNATYWLIDGQPAEMPAPGIVNQVLRHGGVSEFFAFDLTAEQFDRLADARSVEFKVCADEYKLKERGLADIKEIRQFEF